ncbi:MAG: hypothetical protein WBF83_04405 [Moheibacter sp.]
MKKAVLGIIIVFAVVLSAFAYFHILIGFQIFCVAMVLIPLRNAETGKTEYEKLSTIHIKKELVPTYTIQALSEGSVFIANGFVTTAY